MDVTFRADGRVLNYSPGKVYTEKLNPLLKALLENGSILVLIDPLTLDEPVPAPVKVPEPKPEPEIARLEDDGAPIQPKRQNILRETPKPEPVKVEKDNEESDEDKE